jgi:hypothetical protein
MPHGHGLTDFLYQRDERLLLLRSLSGGGRIGFVVCGAGGRYRPGIRARGAPASAMKNGHCQIQIQPHGPNPASTALSSGTITRFLPLRSAVAVGSS